jgi:hypothetical protein
MDQSADALTRETTLLSIDVESNGLHGPAFAVGAVLVRVDGALLDEFTGRCPVEGEVDKWVKQNVLKPMREVPENYDTALKMRDAFWLWFKAAKEKADYVMVDNGYPVEMRFLLQCQADDSEGRYWDHAYPILDLSSMLLMVGIKPLAVKQQLLGDELPADSKRHHPRWDAWVSAMVALKAWEMAGRIPPSDPKA